MTEIYEEETQDETTDANILLAGLEFLAEGISVVPASSDGSKAPLGSWKKYQSQRANPQEVVDWLRNAQGFGVITGAVSGNLEMLELEGRAVAADLHVQAKELAYNSGLEDVWELLSTTYIEQTPSGGIHWLYRISDSDVPGNTKLARRPGENGGVDVLAETRGEGGFVIVAPSHGATHPSGEAWVRLNDSTPASIKNLTIEERDALHDIFRALDQMPDVEAVSHAISAKDPDGRLSPGDDYNQRANWDDILLSRGWAKIFNKGSEIHWRRPGKTVGTSATTGRNDSDNLYVFTTSTVFEPQKPHSKFAAFTLLEYGDLSSTSFSIAARTLRQQGYGDIVLVPEISPLNDFKPVIDSDEYLDANDPKTASDAAVRRHEALVAQEVESQRARREAKKLIDNEEALKSYSEPVFVANLFEELQLPDEEEEWVIEGLMTAGSNVLLTAAYKAGKTTMVNNLVKSLVDNEPFLGEHDIQNHSGRVVIFNYEVDSRQYRRWIRDVGIINAENVTMIHLRGKRLPMTINHVEDQVSTMLKKLECETWIIDPFARAFSGSGDENSNSDVGVFLETLDVIKHRAGVSNLILPVHTGRAAEHGIERARGATRIDDWADVRWLLNKNNDGNRFFSASGRDVEEEERHLKFDKETRTFSLGEAGNRETYKINEIESSIIAHLIDNPGTSAGDLYAAVGGNSSQYRDARRSAIKAGKVHQVGAGRSALFFATEIKAWPIDAQKEA